VTENLISKSITTIREEVFDEMTAALSDAGLALSSMYHPAYSLLQQNPMNTDLRSVLRRVSSELCTLLHKTGRFVHSRLNQLEENMTLHWILAIILTEPHPLAHPALKNSFVGNAINTSLDPQLFAKEQIRLNPNPALAHLEEAAFTRVLQVYCAATKDQITGNLGEPSFDKDVENLDNREGVQNFRNYPLSLIARVHREMYCLNWIVSEKPPLTSTLKISDDALKHVSPFSHITHVQFFLILMDPTIAHTWYFSTD
jgi:hypothetical protein